MTRPFDLTPEDLPNVTDVVCVAEPRAPGAIAAFANAPGRNALQKVFPEWSIPWEPNAVTLPPDWLLALFHMPTLAERYGIRDLESITGGAPLEDATPAALAFLLATVAKDQGARAATWDGQVLDLYTPPRGNN
jgi:hypothetical protein